jgi:hypothetical protein
MPRKRWQAQVAVIYRTKDADGVFRFHSAKRKGPKPSDCRYYLRFTDANGHQQRKSLPEGSTYEDAWREKDVQASALTAALRGIAVPEAEQRHGRTPVQKAVTAFLESKSAKTRRTLIAYKHNLSRFVESLQARVQFVEDIDAGWQGFTFGLSLLPDPWKLRAVGQARSSCVCVRAVAPYTC